MELRHSDRRRVLTPCRNHRLCRVHPSHQPQLDPRNGTRFVRSCHHSSHSNTYAKEDGRRMGRKTQIVVHSERFPTWSHHEHTRRAWQTLLFTIKAYQHSIPQHHTNTNSNSRTSRHSLVPTRCLRQATPQSWTSHQLGQHSHAPHILWYETWKNNKHALTDSELSSATKTNFNSTWSKSKRQTVLTRKKWWTGKTSLST